jgi:hypothetical protein
MPSHFRQYWQQSTCDDLKKDGWESRPLDHTASNLFKSRGVSSSDLIYVVTIRQGKMHLVGRLVVSEVVSMAEARRRLPYEPYQARDHALAVRGSATAMLFSRVVPIVRVRQLRFEAQGAQRSLVWVSRHQLDQQTLRGVRRVTTNSARLLDTLL